MSQAGWKLLGDILVQHADVAPHLDQHDAGAGVGAGSKDGAACVHVLVAAAAAQRRRMAGARRAYAAALHLDPTQGGWVMLH